MAIDNTAATGDKNSSPLDNDNGSVVFIVLILLALLTIVGICATDMSVTESFIVRNTAIASQNLYLADAAAKVGTMWLLGQTNSSQLDPILTTQPWIHALTWNQNVTLDDANSATPPLTVTNGGSTVSTGIDKVLAQRGEVSGGAEQTLRYYFMGWTASQGSLKVTQPTWKAGRVIGVYNSPHYGQVTVEMWVQKKF